jgi:hypothetical protein
MKKVFIILLLAALVLIVAIFFRHTQLSSPYSILLTNNIGSYNGRAGLATNIQVPPPSSAVLFPAPGTNIPIRPTSVDEETWNRWLAYRRFILEQNPPVEFYARVVDQDGQPVVGAKLTVKLTRMEGMAFATTNFDAWDPAKAIQDTVLDLYSDTNGWIQLIGVTGRDLRVEALEKDGYSWTIPQIGSFVYEPNGEHRVGNAGMEDAFDPNKGYVFHLQKIEGK